MVYKHILNRAMFSTPAFRTSHKLALNHKPLVIWPLKSVYWSQTYLLPYRNSFAFDNLLQLSLKYDLLILSWYHPKSSSKPCSFNHPNEQQSSSSDTLLSVIVNLLLTSILLNYQFFSQICFQNKNLTFN